MKSETRFMLLFFLPLIFLAGCGSKKKNEEQPEVDFQTRVRIQQYVSAGRQLYNTHCANCHQAEGEGFAALYPPVKNADYFQEDVPRSVCIMKFGMEGEIMVNGKSYNQMMPAFNDLTNLELAEITTFLLNVFNDSTAIVTQHQIREYLEECGG